MTTAQAAPKRPPRPEKVRQVEQLAQAIQKSSSLVVVENTGITVAEITELRIALSREESALKVAKNTLVQLALQSSQAEAMADFFQGPTALVFSFGDPTAAPRVVLRFLKDHPKLVVKGGWLEGRKLSAAEVKALAELPGRAELLGRLAAALQGPIRGLIYVLSGPARKLVYALQAVREAKAKTA